MGSRGASIPMGDGYDGYGFRRPSHRQAGDPTRGLAYVTAPGLCCCCDCCCPRSKKRWFDFIFMQSWGREEETRARGRVGSTGGARGRRGGMKPFTHTPLACFLSPTPSPIGILDRRGEFGQATNCNQPTCLSFERTTNDRNSSNHQFSDPTTT